MSKNLINNKFMSSPNDILDDLPNIVRQLLSRHSRKEIIEKGIDKNLLYRLENNDNITTRNLKKIKNAFPEVFNKQHTANGIADLPIVGLIQTEYKIAPLTPTWPQTVKVPAGMIEYWSPIFAYHNNSPTTFDNLVFIFSSKNINSTQVTDECLKRHIIIFPKNEAPTFGLCVADKNNYKVIHPVERNQSVKIPKDNDYSWAYLVHAQPYALIDFLTNSEQAKKDSLEAHQKVINITKPRG